MRIWLLNFHSSVGGLIFPSGSFQKVLFFLRVLKFYKVASKWVIFPTYYSWPLGDSFNVKMYVLFQEIFLQDFSFTILSLSGSRITQLLDFLDRFLYPFFSFIFPISGGACYLYLHNLLYYWRLLCSHQFIKIIILLLTSVSDCSRIFAFTTLSA